jgi:hypothetical protein
MTALSLTRPLPGECDPYFERYTSLVPDPDLATAFRMQKEEFPEMLRGVDDDRAGSRYAERKWTVREVVGHVVDTERVFGYRALCVARGETLSLPSMDENLYAANGGFEDAPLSLLLREFGALRESHILMFEHMSPAALERRGLANQRPVTARALALIMIGHCRHHMAILRERYRV